MKTFTATPRADLYTRVTERVIADLEKGVRPWLQPWNAGHAAGRITVPRRHNGVSYRGINILLLWGEAIANGYTSPLWMTFKQALALDAHVRASTVRWSFSRTASPRRKPMPTATTSSARSRS